MEDFEKLNKKATKDLKKILKDTPNISFTEEKPTGFYLDTPYGRFWFECEVVDTI